MSSFKGAAGHCSGSIIGDQFVVTASHCCSFAIVGRDLVTGSLKSSGDDDIDENESKFKIVAYRQHADFDKDNMNDDICVIKVDRSFTFSKRVHPVCLYIGANLPEER